MHYSSESPTHPTPPGASMPTPARADSYRAALVAGIDRSQMSPESLMVSAWPPLSDRSPAPQPLTVWPMDPTIIPPQPHQSPLVPSVWPPMSVPPSPPVLSSWEMKRFITAYTSNGAQPLRILGDMIPKLKLTEVSIPKLCQVQRVANYFKKTSIMETALVSQMASTARSLAYTDDIDETTPFTFATPIDPYGVPFVGNGSDERPFLIGVSTKRLMRGLVMAATHPLHIDGTYKVCQQGYPMVAVGVSDAGRSVHVAAVFISSHLRGVQYATIFTNVFDTFHRVTGSTLEVKHVAGDADDAQFNACRDVVFARCPRATFLMCFFHVMQKVKQRVLKMADTEKRLVFKHVYRIHHTRDEAAKTAAVALAIDTWKTTPKLLEFSKYFVREWLDSRFNRWQCFHSAIGHAKTNNPVEQFNKAFKRDYTKRRLLPTNGLMEEMKSLCKTNSTRVAAFKRKNIVTPDLPRRLKYLRRARLISHTRIQRSSLDFILQGAGQETKILVRQHGIDKAGFPLIKTDEKRRPTLWAEVYGQPAIGWTVDVLARCCPCDWWFKFGCCVHLVEALAIFGVEMDSQAAEESETFIDRRRKNKRPAPDTTPDEDEHSDSAAPNRGGRPTAIGHALSYV